MSEQEREQRERRRKYWEANKRILAGLMTAWFLVSYGFGIIGADWLNQYTLPGTSFPLGFWFAQQGSIYLFVCLIFIYVVLMDRLDRQFDVDET